MTEALAGDLLGAACRYRHALAAFTTGRPLRFACVLFGSGHWQEDSPVGMEVAAVASQLASDGVDVVTGGEGLGLMEAANRAAFTADGGGRSIGVLIRGKKASAHLHEALYAADHTSRMDVFAAVGSMFVCLPGGLGTDLERAVVTHHIARLQHAVGTELDHIRFAGAAHRFVPKLFAAGALYEHVRGLHSAMLSARLMSPSAAPLCHYLPDAAAVTAAALEERRRWRASARAAGLCPLN